MKTKLINIETISTSFNRIKSLQKKNIITEDFRKQVYSLIGCIIKNMKNKLLVSENQCNLEDYQIHFTEYKIIQYSPNDPLMINAPSGFFVNKDGVYGINTDNTLFKMDKDAEHDLLRLFVNDLAIGLLEKIADCLDFQKQVEQRILNNVANDLEKLFAE